MIMSDWSTAYGVSLASHTLHLEEAKKQSDWSAMFLQPVWVYVLVPGLFLLQAKGVACQTNMVYSDWKLGLHDFRFNVM